MQTEPLKLHNNYQSLFVFDTSKFSIFLHLDLAVIQHPSPCRRRLSRPSANKRKLDINNFHLRPYHHLQQVGGRVVLPELPLVEHHDPVVVEDGVEPVGDGQHAAPRKLLPDGRLDQVVCLKVHRRRGLVQDKHLVQCILKSMLN